MIDEPSLLNTEQGRRRILDVILNITKGTALEPQLYEQVLLDQFVRGELTDEHVLILLRAVKFH
ncbi:hypothetical protein [Hymenobacter terrenus]|uniref:hypothetical protein n=1 Tax=Hymenobacter terrenus TaxID=1629124 RepID=UPI0006193528|nr:hypothetical protein [Hymenobacter terrenus]